MLDKIFAFIRAHSKDAIAVGTAFGASTIVALIYGIADPTTIVTASVAGVGALATVLAKNKLTGFARVIKFILAIATAVGTPSIVALITGGLTPELIVVGIFQFLGAISVYETTEVAPEAPVIQNLRDQVFQDDKVSQAPAVQTLKVVSVQLNEGK